MKKKTAIKNIEKALSVYIEDSISNDPCEIKRIEKSFEVIKNNEDTKEFPNGFTNWQETHYEVVAAITKAMNEEEEGEPEFKNTAILRREEQGTGGLYELAEELTDKFEKMNKGREWYGKFFDEIEEFLNKELYPNK